MATTAPPPNGVPRLRRRSIRAASQTLLSRFHWFLDVPPEHLEHMGFFTDSYILFATNSILPMLSYVYQNTSTDQSFSMSIKCASLAGCFCGMIGFGYLADKFGRQRLYGMVLLTLIAGTFGLVMSSPGYTWMDMNPEKEPVQYSSMNVTALLIFWRFISGLGIGGDYPLSAVMVSEMAPTKRRASMLAWLFSMQAFGYAAALVTSIVVVKVVRHYHPQPSQVSVDQIWRWVVGLSLVPASISVLMRFFVPESPRFTLYVLNYPFRALQDADTLNQAGVQNKYETEYANRLIQEYQTGRKSYQAEPFHPMMIQTGTHKLSSVPSRRRHNNINLKSFWQYQRSNGNGRKLVVTSVTWFLLDVTFFGLDFSTTQTLSTVWTDSKTTLNQTALPLWDTNQLNHWDRNITTMFDPSGLASSPWDTTSIYTILIQNSWRSLIVSSVSTILGSIVLILTIERLNRKKLQWIGFGVLGIFLVVTGSVYKFSIHENQQGLVIVDHAPQVATIILYAIAHFFFSFGPNALTFIVAAELFPTKFRCTCHGISAAAGKLGSIIVQLVIAYSEFPGRCANNRCHFNSPGTTGLAYLLIGFALPTLIGCGITWAWLPEVQETSRSLKNRSIPLEQLAEDRHNSPFGKGTSHQV